MQYELIYERKNDPDFYDRNMARKMEVLEMTDEDLIVDFKLGRKKIIHNLFEANTATFT